MAAERIRVTGTVQGVGFRPTVWRLAGECGIVGTVRNDAEGVLIEAWGDTAGLDALVHRLHAEKPPLSVIDSVVRTRVAAARTAPETFTIQTSAAGQTATNVAADAATCGDCLAEIGDPRNRRFRYPFTNCTHCGPRLSIIRAVPYDRRSTSMASFPMCPECRAEYEDPADRRFHAQPNACPDCGPTAWLEDRHGKRVDSGDRDAIAAAAGLMAEGRIVAVKGIGGFHLACLATDAGAVDTLRARKQRYRKAFAMMARDLETIRRYARVGAEEEAALRGRRAPIVILEAGGMRLPEGIAPGQDTLGFMLPYTPLHHLLLADMDAPVVMTSGNRSDEPQVTDNDVARDRLADIADFFLMHDRDIVNRLDDSVLLASGGVRQMLRRARGFAPEPIELHPSFAGAAPILAMGGELKNTFCLLRGAVAIVSQHIGDMEDAGALGDCLGNMRLYLSLYDFEPEHVAVDRHPDYLPTKMAAAQFAELRHVDVQHHHAHVAACMAEHGLGIDSAPVLGVVLDGLGLGDDGALWGGEFLKADYADFQRLARFQPVPMPGGSRAMREPWRNAWAHLHTAFGWRLAVERYGDLQALRRLREKPVETLERMLSRGVNSPPASSAGRLFDAVAAMLDICPDGISHEAQAAIELETLATAAADSDVGPPYPLDVVDGDVLTVGWRSLWSALLDDLRRGAAREVIAARFHLGLAGGLADLAVRLARRHSLDTVVLGGGVFQNRLLLAGTSARLRDAGLGVLQPSLLPANDGGISLGQAVVCARVLRDERLSSPPT